MIDSHCHLEYMENAGEVVERCRKSIRAVVSVATHPKDFDKGLNLAKENKGFVFLAAGIHPESVRELDEKDVANAFRWITDNSGAIVGIGEQGLDYNWVEETSLREKQKELFVKMIRLSKELDKMIIVHTRDAHEDVMKILEKERAERVQMHMWGEPADVKAISDHGWYVSVGPIVATSKKHKKVVRDMPIELLMLETDSPWFGGKDASGKLLGEPTNIRIPATEIAKIKEMPPDDVWKACGENAIKAFRLPVKL